MTTIVNGLQKEFGDVVAVEVYDATTTENKAKIRDEFGFKTHGLVIYDGQGLIKEKLDGHMLKEEQIREALERVLPEGQPSP